MERKKIKYLTTRREGGGKTSSRWGSCEKEVEFLVGLCGESGTERTEPNLCTGELSEFVPLAVEKELRFSAKSKALGSLRVLDEAEAGLIWDDPSEVVVEDTLERAKGDFNLEKKEGEGECDSNEISDFLPKVELVPISVWGD